MREVSGKFVYSINAICPKCNTIIDVAQTKESFSDYYGIRVGARDLMFLVIYDHEATGYWDNIGFIFHCTSCSEKLILKKLIDEREDKKRKNDNYN
jgi:hypothetical protein